MQLPDPLIFGLTASAGHGRAQDILRAGIEASAGRIAMVSSFGAEAAVLLHMLAQIDADVPVLMLDTLLLFPETLAYQQDLTEHLGLRDVRRITPDETPDADRTLHQRDTDACCMLRKTVPLDNALKDFDAVITGRKRFQTGARATMDPFERDGEGRLRVNPLAMWQPDQIATYLTEYDLPRHPLVARGYPSIGCAPCTSPVRAGESARAGRWRGEDREECGIHITADGSIERRPL